LEDKVCSYNSVYARLRSVSSARSRRKTELRTEKNRKPVSPKELAEHLGLSPATVSLVINRSPVADSIPQQTKDRVLEAAREFKYRPNFFARSLRAPEVLP
jgi:hypothetical protein